jgi:hypothetical protein
MSVQFSFDGPLLLIRFFGELTEADLDATIDRVLEIEEGGTNTPDRLIDLSGITQMRIGYTEMARLAEITRTRPLARPVRSAMTVSAPVQLGFARMFQILNEHPRVVLRIFENERDARAWLAAPLVQDTPGDRS